MARIAIVGCGYVGTALGAALVADGDRVWGVRRSDAPLPDGVALLRADCARRPSLDVLPDALDAVVYAVGADAPDEAAYRRAYVTGLANVLAVLDARGGPGPRVLFTSSTAVYGQSGGEWVDEASPTEPTRFSGRILLEAEGLLAGRGVRGLVLRLGGLYGPGRTRLVERVASGAARCRPGPPHYTNRIHRDDAAGAIRHLLALSDPPRLVLGVDGAPADECDVLRWLAARLGAAPPAEEAEEDEGSAPRRAGSKRCRNARLLASGYRLRHPDFRSGYAEVVRSFLESAGGPAAD